MMWEFTYQDQNATPNVPHFNHIITRSLETTASEESSDSKWIEKSRLSDCEPIKMASTAKGRDAKPRRRATRGDWSTYVCWRDWMSDGHSSSEI